MVKRAQSNILVTILIVLVVLGAISIIAVFLINQVKDNVQTAEIRAKVSAVEIAVTDAKAGSNFILLQRTSNNPDVVIANISIVINNNLINSSIDLSNGWVVLETKKASLKVNLGNYILQKGDIIEVYVIPGNISKVIPVEVAKTNVILEGGTNDPSLNNNYITACGSISQSGTYIFQNDLTRSGTCLNVIGNNILINFGGYSITSSSFFNNFGVYVKDSNNITLKNGKVSLFDKGLMIENSKSVTIDSLVLINNSIGLYDFNSDLTKTYNLLSTNNSLGGVYLINASNFQVITSSSVLNNGNSSGHGIYMTNSSGLCGPVISYTNRVDDLFCEKGSIFSSGGSSIGSLSVSTGCSLSFGGC